MPSPTIPMLMPTRTLHTGAFLLLLILGAPGQSYAETTNNKANKANKNSAVLTVEQAVSIALQNPSLRPDVEASRRAQEESIESETQRVLPEAALTHENIPGTSPLSMYQTTLAVSYNLDLTPWRNTLKTALEHQDKIAKLQDEQWDNEISNSVKNAYFKTLYGHKKHTLKVLQIKRLEQAREDVLKRVEHGDASLYEVRRLEQELKIVEADHALEHINYTASRAELIAWLDWPSLDALPPLDGELLPTHDMLEPDTQLLQKKLLAQPALLQLEEQRSIEEIRASSFSTKNFWLRDLQIQAGYRIASMQNSPSAHGFVIELSAPIPLWDNATANKDVHLAQSKLLGSQQEQHKRMLLREHHVQLAMYTSLATSYSNLTLQTSQPSVQELSMLAYKAGEITLMELLDAYRSETEIELKILDVQWQLRQCWLSIEYLSGISTHVAQYQNVSSH